MRSAQGTFTLLAAACATALAGIPAALADDEVAKGNTNLQVTLSLLSRYDSGIRGASAAEIVQHDPLSQRLFIVNAQARSVDVLDIAQPAVPLPVGSLTESGSGPANSVAIFEGLVAVAFEAPVKTDPGSVVFYDARTLERLAAFTAGALPDMLTFTPDGQAVLVANEGEPNNVTDAAAAYTIDPPGSVSVIDLSRVKKRLDGAELQARGIVRTAGFERFNGKLDELRAAGVRIYGTFNGGSTVAQDLEPEYIAVAHDGKSAWVALQEANAVGVLDLANPSRPYFREILPLGLKDHSLPGNELDASDRDNRIDIRNWPVKGLYEPDAIASYAVRGKTYYVLANEGDDRNDFVAPAAETGRVRALADAGQIDPAVFDLPLLRDNANLGRLTVTTAQVPRNAAGQMTELHALGGRSFSIRDAAGNLLYDSGAEFERITAERLPRVFNTSNDNNAFEDRSDNKGPEPEGITVGTIRGRTFAFIGLERVGGIMTYDVTNPTTPRFVDYVNSRDFSLEPLGAAPIDAGPEGLAFIAAEDSPNGQPLVVVANEVSGTTVIYSVEVTRP